MTVDELKRKVDAYRKDLKAKSGKAVVFSETGPVGISLIEAIVAALETQQRQSEKLEKEVDEAGRLQ